MISFTRRKATQVPMTFFIVMLYLLISMLTTVWAEDKKKLILDEVKVVGSKSNVKDIASSAAYIDVTDIKKHSYDNIDRVLRKIPGVYTREETGNGLFPNISIRGVDPGRSTKVTIMEDGIISAPAPYSAAAAYYAPTTGRMAGIEILKGSSQVRYGPQTTGGVINYLSTPIPTDERYYLKSTYGMYGEIRNHLYFGNTIQTDNGSLGFVVENYDRRNEGFRRINETDDFRNGNENNGLKNTEPMFKVAWEPNSEKYQRFELKLGYTYRQINETYLGLNESLFNQDPYQRLAASRFDKIDAEHFRSYLRHFFELNKDTNIVTTGYGNHFFRNWQKGNKCKTPVSLSLSQCISDTDGQALLNGTGAGTFTLKNNNRNYYLWGVQSQLTHNHKIGSVDHKFVAGVRWHYDQIRRFQVEETYTQDSNGMITSRAVGEAGAAGNRRQKSHALAINLEDKMQFGKLSFTPGVRYEHLWQRFQQFEPTTEKNRERDYGVWSGGANVGYKINENSNLFGGAYRGVSLPGPSGATKTGEDQVDEETSMGYEVGARYSRPQNGLLIELIGFRTDFEDLVVSDIQGAAGNIDGETRNIGEVTTQGIEFQFQVDPSISAGWKVKTPIYFTATFTDAEFSSGVGSTSISDEGIFSGAQDGNAVPYIPDMQFAAGLGLIFEKLSINADVTFTDETFGSASNVTTETDVDGDADPRFGLVDELFLLDISVGYQLNPKVKAFTNFRNVTDETYIAGRLPHGVRSGAPFMAFGGVEFDF
jgi:Fe(3+) dicitrate transport protein